MASDAFLILARPKRANFLLAPIPLLPIIVYAGLCFVQRAFVYGLAMAAFVVFALAYLYSAAVVVISDGERLGLRRFGVTQWSVPFADMELEEDMGPLGGLLVRQKSSGKEHTILWSVFPQGLASAIREQMQLSLSRQQA